VTSRAPIADRQGFWHVLAADLRAMVVPRSASNSAWALEVASKILLYPRVRAVIAYRLGQVLARGRRLPLAYALEARAIRASGAEISPLAQLGPGLCLMHSVGIVIGGGVRAGRNLNLYQGVTLGDGSVPGQPTIGDDVTIGAGAAVLGGVVIGNRVVIGAHAVVTRNVPDDATAIGAPATWRTRESDPPGDDAISGGRRPPEAGA
jgi:serine O-acetyltransferase